MIGLRAKRGPIRASFTKTVTTLETELANPEPKRISLNTLLDNLEKRATKLTELDEKISELMLTDGATEEEHAAEFDGVTVYTDLLDSCRRKIEEALSTIDQPESSYASVAGEAVGERQKRYKLPKIEFCKFSGEIKEWLAFWNMFKKIHEDDKIPAEDKFQYLKQATTPGSKARSVIDGFPMSAENYPKAINHLKSRFGEETMLVEVYVRELLRLVLANALNPKQKIGLSTLYDKLESQLRALESLGLTSDKYAAIFYPLVESSLPEDVLVAWERNKSFHNAPVQVNPDGSTAYPNYLTRLMTFLRGEVTSEEKINLVRSGFGINPDTKQKVRKSNERSEEVATAAGLLNENQTDVRDRNCIFCDKPHSSWGCTKAKNMQHEDRVQILMKKRACLSCLTVGHMAKNCGRRAQLNCKRCKGQHLAIMCRESTNSKVENSTVSKNERSPGVSDSALANQTTTEEVVLMTLMVRVTQNGKEKIVRAIYDGGSQRTYILQALAREMKFRCLGEQELIHGLFGGTQTAKQNHTKYLVNVESLDGSYCCKVNALDEPRICGSIPKLKSGPWISQFKSKKVELTDLGEGTSDVQLLIGSDIGGKLFTGQMERLENGLVAWNTHLGWVMTGRLPESKNKDCTTLFVHDLFVREAEMSELWRLDTIGIVDAAETKRKEECQKETMEHFKKTVRVLNDGRYEISLPWIAGHPPLKTNRLLAERRLVSMTKKLSPEARTVYQGIFDDWESQGIIEKLPLSEEEMEKVHYLPHRAVLKPNSLTTKVRPVFDASAKEKGSPSLNECLAKGPNLLEIITAVVSRFRMRKIGVIADIKKAFLQISIRPEDRDYLRFLWWCEGRLTEYRHKRVVFGISSSPFLLAATIDTVLENSPVGFQETARLLRKSNYVDNCCTSLDDVEAAQKFREESVMMLSKAKLDLRGWESNEEELSDHVIETDGPRRIGVLGLTWDMTEDTLICDLNKGENCIGSPITMKKILSAAHQVFDPIGFTAPLLIHPKMLLQRCWELKAGWDDELPEEIAEQFLTWQKRMVEVGEVRIPRWIGCKTGEEEKWSLQAFSDASKLAYSACVFLRVQKEDSVYVSLVQAKARVSPLKKLSIPRLELLGCSILARLVATVKTEMNMEDIPCTYWTDSSNCLYWIGNEDSWGTYVWNRVAEIRKLSKVENWRHVPGNLNPADLPSRGCTAKQLMESKWWEGPPWLKLPEEEWPMNAFEVDDEAIRVERKKTVVVCAVKVVERKDVGWITAHSNKYQRIVRVLAFVLRFVCNVRKCRKKRLLGEISLNEWETAETNLIRLVQIEAFDEGDAALKRLNVFKDEHGILRVKTRLLMREDSREFKTPAVLPGNHPVVKSMVVDLHEKLSHCGSNTLLSNLREKFWIVKSRTVVKTIIRNCGKCRRFKAKSFQTEPAPLPLDRVKDAAVFEVTGIDLAGPLFLRDGSKVWFVIFTCAVYRAIHLELVSTLTTTDFLKSFQRFTSRRGRPKIVYSDNGTNFVGAANALKKIDWKKIESTATSLKIDWKFNPPSAAWWGGWWERLIGLVKDLLRRVLGKARLDYEELMTVLCECESVVNKRPLTLITEDADDLIPLTPELFLHEARNDGVPEMLEVDAKMLERRIRYCKTLRRDLRVRFRKEYLGELVQRGRAKKATRKIEVGDIVYIGSDNIKKMNWPLGRVTAVYPGKDLNTRVAKVKTMDGDFVRPVQRLYPVEVTEGNMDKSVGDAASAVRSEGSPPLDPKSCSPITVTRSGRVVKPPRRLEV